MNTMKQVDDGGEKARGSESLEEQVIDEVTVSKEIHAPLRVECTTVEVSTYILYYEYSNLNTLPQLLLFC